MLEILLIYFLGKQFYELAGKYDRNQWKYAVAGGLSYYLGAFLGSIFILTIAEWNSPGAGDRISNLVLTLISFPFGLVTAKGIYIWAEKHLIDRQAKIGLKEHSDILDEGFLA